MAFRMPRRNGGDARPRHRTFGPPQGDRFGRYYVNESSVFHGEDCGILPHNCRISRPDSALARPALIAVRSNVVPGM